MRSRAFQYVILVLGVFAFIPFFSCTLIRFVKISSSPEGATIIIDGVRQSKTTPAKIRLSPNKSHIIRVKKEGYYTATDTVAPGGGGYGARKPKTSFHFELKPLPSQMARNLSSSSRRINLSDTENFIVGVMDVNLSGNIPKELQTPLTVAIIAGLLGLKKFKVIDRANRDAILGEQASQLAVCLGGECSVVEVGRLIGVNRMVISYVSRIRNKFYITITMVNIETGFVEALSEDTVSCDISELPIHVKRVTRNLFK